MVAIAELQFGADYRPDFVVAADRASYGFRYEFIEFQSPHDTAYIGKGKQAKPSSALSEAVSQVEQWQIWLSANRGEAKKLFPSKQFQSTDVSDFSFSIVIGRRSDEEEFVHLRNYFAQKTQIDIRSYDHLTDKLAERFFFPLPMIFSAEMEALDIKDRNELASPFVTAYRS